MRYWAKTVLCYLRQLSQTLAAPAVYLAAQNAAALALQPPPGEPDGSDGLGGEVEEVRRDET